MAASGNAPPPPCRAALTTWQTATLNRMPPHHQQRPLWCWDPTQSALDDVRNALTTCSRLECVLERSCGVFCLLGELLGKSSGHQTAEEVPNNNPSDTTVKFPQSGHAPHAEGVDNLLRTSPLGERVRNVANSSVSGPLSSIGRKCSAVMPEGPGAPRLELLKVRAK